VEKQGKTVACY